MKMLPILISTLAILGITACKGQAPSGASAENAAVAPEADKGIGPVSSVTLGPLDPQLASKGKTLFDAKCSACHKIDEKYVGPALKGVTTRRTPEWIMNMVLNPAEMTQKNATAKDLLATHYTQMTFQNVTQDEVRSILEYFRQNDATSK